MTQKERLAAIERRLAELEKHSHVPIDQSAIFRRLDRLEAIQLRAATWLVSAGAFLTEYGHQTIEKLK